MACLSVSKQSWTDQGPISNRLMWSRSQESAVTLFKIGFGICGIADINGIACVVLAVAWGCRHLSRTTSEINVHFPESGKWKSNWTQNEWYNYWKQRWSIYEFTMFIWKCRFPFTACRWDYFCDGWIRIARYTKSNLQERIPFAYFKDRKSGNNTSSVLGNE